MLEELDCRNLKGLKKFYAQENGLKECRFGLHPWLKWIDLAENELTDLVLDINRCKKLVNFLVGIIY